MRAPIFVASLAIALTGVAGAQTETYPTHPITIIVPFPAGGPTDTLARIVGESLKNSLGQPIIIENVTGAGATIGVGRVAQSAPDGYTLSIGNWTSHVGAPVLYPVTWDVLTDFEPVARLSVSTMMMVGKTALPANNANELIAWLQANPDKASSASVGSGSAAHICGLHFEQQTNTKFQFVFYRGGAPAMQDLLAGQIDIMCAEASQTLAHVRAGKLKAFAVMSKQRWSPLPDVPTMQEVGVSGMEISFWNGLWVPKGTPKDVIAKLNDAVVKAFDDPNVKKRISDLGQIIPPKDQLTPAALHDHHKAETAKWWPIIKAAGIKTH
jgi:tripartite-type tricarboxylate transporter receptor subunit TctC